MLVLGFCPLRNTLGTLLFRPSDATPKTNGSHLLNADDHYNVLLVQHVTGNRQNTLLRSKNIFL